MFRLTLCTVVMLSGILSLLAGACTQSPEQAPAVTPLEVTREASPGEYIDVILQVSSDQPCRLVLATPHKTEVENYLSPYSSETLTYPDNEETFVFHERIPFDTAPGSYVLKVIQMRDDEDTEGVEIFSRVFIVR